MEEINKIKFKTLSDFKRDMWNKKKCIDKVKYFYWNILFNIEHYFRKITKICPHDSTIGEVTKGKCICIDCGKKLNIKDFKN